MSHPILPGYIAGVLCSSLVWFVCIFLQSSSWWAAVPTDGCRQIPNNPFSHMWRPHFSHMSKKLFFALQHPFSRCVTPTLPIYYDIMYRISSTADSSRNSLLLYCSRPTAGPPSSNARWRRRRRGQGGGQLLAASQVLIAHHLLHTNLFDQPLNTNLNITNLLHTRCGHRRGGGEFHHGRATRPCDCALLPANRTRGALSGRRRTRARVGHDRRRANPRVRGRLGARPGGAHPSSPNPPPLTPP